MDLLSAEVFFDLTRFVHAEIFLSTEPVWVALQKIKTYLLSQSLGEVSGRIERGAYLVNPEQISIGKGSVVESGAYVKGPCIIGENCQVRHGAYIRGNVLVADKCVIGHATEVKNSIFFEGAQAGHFAYVGDSILGNRVNLGAGTKCANLRFDKKHVSVVWHDKKIETGLQKFGAILGDGVQTGCNSVTNPGTLVKKNRFIAPCAAVQGVIP